MRPKALKRRRTFLLEMTVWQVIVTLDTTVPAQSTDLVQVRNIANKLSGFSQKQLQPATSWQITMLLDDTDATQAAVLAAVYQRLPTLTNVIVQKTGA